jgi:hypothetical protein
MGHHITPLPLPILPERTEPVRPRAPARGRETTPAEWADEAISEDEAIDMISAVDEEPRRRSRRRASMARLRQSVTAASQTLSDDTLRTLLAVQEIPDGSA